MADIKPQLAIYDILRKRFPENEYALVQEVSDTTGGRNRSADWFAINLWPSRGLAFHCLEQKRSRGDWLNELKNPKKQERHIKFCDYFWLLTTDESIAKMEEIPSNWGWLNIKNNKVYTLKQAPKLVPEQLTKSFTCALLRRACDLSNFVHKESIEETIEQKVQQRLSLKNSQLENANQVYKSQNEELKKIISDFETASGLTLSNRWNAAGYKPSEIGEAVKKVLLQDKSINNIEYQLKRLNDNATLIVENLKVQINDIFSNQKENGN